MMSPFEVGDKVTVLQANPDNNQRLIWRTIGRGEITALTQSSARVRGSDGEYVFHEWFAISAKRSKVIAL